MPISISRKKYFNNLVFFSDGAHPFGDNFKRQANILAQDYRYDHLVVSWEIFNFYLLKEDILYRCIYQNVDYNSNTTS